MLRKILAGSRYLIVIAVIGSFLAAIGTLVYGGLTVVSIMFESFSHVEFTVEGAKHLELESIEIIDLFLLGTVLYVVVVLLAVTFLGEEVNWNGSNNIVAVGIAVGLVLFALGFILRQGFEVYAGRRTKESDVE